jgi:hypothetical protein
MPYTPRKEVKHQFVAICGSLGAFGTVPDTNSLTVSPRTQWSSPSYVAAKPPINGHPWPDANRFTEHSPGGWEPSQVGCAEEQQDNECSCNNEVAAHLEIMKSV